MFRKKTNEKKEILLQSFYNLEDKLTRKLGMEKIVLAVTASSANTNKTQSIYHMAHHLAEDGDRILIVDANLRNSDLPSVTGFDKSRGFIDVILGSYKLDDTIAHDDDFENLDYLYTGQVADYADKFLEPSNIQSFYREVSDRYDYVFIDLSPNIDIPEANMFAANADATIVFSTYDLSNSPITLDSLKQLEKVNANTLGIVVTDYIYSESEIDDLFGVDNE